jgi:arginase
MGAGPEHLLASGLEAKLRAEGHSVVVETIEPDPASWAAEIHTAFELARILAKRVKAARNADRFPLILGGNCNTALGAVAGLGAPLGVMWFDAHGDFNTPEITRGGFLDGMALATVAGRCWRAISERIEGFKPVVDASILLLGARSLDELEKTALDESAIRRLDSSVSAPQLIPLLEAIGRHVDQFYLHLDLDALDPKVGSANEFAVSDGFTLQNLLAVLRAAGASVPIGALTIAFYDPAFDGSGTVRAAAFEAIATTLGAIANRRSGAK